MTKMFTGFRNRLLCEPLTHILWDPWARPLISFFGGASKILKPVFWLKNHQKRVIFACVLYRI